MSVCVLTLFCGCAGGVYGGQGTVWYVPESMLTAALLNATDFGVSLVLRNNRTTLVQVTCFPPPSPLPRQAVQDSAAGIFWRPQAYAVAWRPENKIVALFLL